MKIQEVSAIYTGGGVYVYNGRLEDGNYFMTCDDCLESEVLIVDSDPNATEDSDYQEWQDAHKVASLHHKAAAAFSMKMLKWVLDHEPTSDSNYNRAEISERLRKVGFSQQKGN